MGRKKARKTAAISRLPPKQGTSAFQDSLGKPPATLPQHVESSVPSFANIDFKLPGGLKKSTKNDSGSGSRKDGGGSVRFDAKSFDFRLPGGLKDSGSGSRSRRVGGESVRFDAKSVSSKRSPVFPPPPPSSRQQPDTSGDQSPFAFRFPLRPSERESSVSPQPSSDSAWPFETRSSSIATDNIVSGDHTGTSSISDIGAMQTAGCEPTEESERHKSHVFDRSENVNGGESNAAAGGIPLTDVDADRLERGLRNLVEPISAPPFGKSMESGRRFDKEDPPEDIRVRFQMMPSAKQDPPDQSPPPFAAEASSLVSDVVKPKNRSLDLEEEARHSEKGAIIMQELEPTKIPESLRNKSETLSKEQMMTGWEPHLSSKDPSCGAVEPTDDNKLEKIIKSRPISSTPDRGVHRKEKLSQSVELRGSKTEPLTMKKIGSKGCIDSALDRHREEDAGGKRHDKTDAATVGLRSAEIIEPNEVVVAKPTRRRLSRRSSMTAPSQSQQRESMPSAAIEEKPVQMHLTSASEKTAIQRMCQPIEVDVTKTNRIRRPRRSSIIAPSQSPRRQEAMQSTAREANLAKMDISSSSKPNTNQKMYPNVGHGMELPERWKVDGTKLHMKPPGTQVGSASAASEAGQLRKPADEQVVRRKRQPRRGSIVTPLKADTADNNFVAVAPDQLGVAELSIHSGSVPPHESATRETQTSLPSSSDKSFEPTMAGPGPNQRREYSIMDFVSSPFRTQQQKSKSSTARVDYAPRKEEKEESGNHAVASIEEKALADAGEFDQLRGSQDSIDSSGTLATFSESCSRRRGSSSSLSSHDDTKTRQRVDSKDTDVASKQSKDSSVEHVLSRGTGMIGLLQHRFEHAFYNELGDESEDDGRDDFFQWKAVAQRPKIIWDHAGRVWTKPTTHFVSGGTTRREAQYESIDPSEGNRSYFSNDSFALGSVGDDQDPNRMRVGLHRHSWSDSDTDSEGSGRHFLVSESRVRQELHTVALHAAQMRGIDQEESSDDDDASIEMDKFLRNEGLTEDMIENLHELHNRGGQRDVMKHDIAQAMVELELEGIGLELDGIDDDSDNEDTSQSSTLSQAMGETFSLFKAKSLFMRSTRKKASQPENDEASFVSISSSEGGSHGSEERRRDELALLAREPILAVYQAPAKSEDDELYGSTEEDSFHSLGSTAEIDEEAWNEDQDYMLDVGLEIVSSHRKKKVAFADDSGGIHDEESNAEPKHKAGLSGLLAVFRRQKDEAGADNQNDSGRLIKPDDGSNRSIDASDYENDDSEGRDWLNGFTEVRWDFTDRIDLFGGMQVIWEPPPKQYSDIENPLVPFNERGDDNLTEDFPEWDESESEIIIPIPLLDRAYKKIPKRNRPYALLGFFLLVIVFPISCSLAIVATRSFASEPVPLKTNSPSQAPTSSFFFKEWNQVGQSLAGVEENGQQGFALSLSDDGSLLAVGARKTSCGDTLNCGSVRIYEYRILGNTPTWIRVQRLEGGVKGNQFGFSVAFSGNGRRLAVGSIGDDVNGRNSGLVQVFEQSQTEWVMIGEFRGEDGGDLFGTSISFSRDGRMLAVGAPRHSANRRQESGRVYFFEDIGFTGFSRWIQSRSALSGGSAGGWFGWSLGIDGDGLTVIVGAPVDPNLAVNGYARVYTFDGFDDDWLQVGGDLGYKGKADRFGYSVSISGSGRRVAIGAYNSQTGNATVGEVFVYSLNDQEWFELGPSLVGDSHKADFGYSVALSPEGDHLAVGAPQQDVLMATSSTPNGTSDERIFATGMARVFEFGEDSWSASKDILAGPGDATLGFSVCLAAVGVRIAVGLPLSGAGAARVFD